MAEEEKIIDLKANQTIESLGLDISDNGGFIVRYSVVTNAPTKGQTGWESRMLTFGEGEKQKAMDTMMSIAESKRKK